MRAWANPPGREVPKVRLVHAALQGNLRFPAELGVGTRRIAEPPAWAREPRLVPIGQRVPAGEGVRISPAKPAAATAGSGSWTFRAGTRDAAAEILA